MELDRRLAPGICFGNNTNTTLSEMTSLNTPLTFENLTSTCIKNRKYVNSVAVCQKYPMKLGELIIVEPLQEI